MILELNRKSFSCPDGNLTERQSSSCGTGARHSIEESSSQLPRAVLPCNGFGAAVVSVPPCRSQDLNAFPDGFRASCLGRNLTVKETFSGGTALLWSVKMKYSTHPTATFPTFGSLLLRLSRNSVGSSRNFRKKECTVTSPCGSG